MQALLREREKQMANGSGQDLSEVLSDSEGIERLTDVQAKQTLEGQKLPKYESYAHAVQEVAVKKRRVLYMLSQESDPETVKKLKLAEANLKNRPTLERRDLELNLEQGKYLESSLCLVVLPPDHQLSAPREHMLSSLSLKVVTWSKGWDFLVSLAAAKHVIWLASSLAEESRVIHLQEVADDAEGFLLGSRMFGGYIGTVEWLDACHACPVKKTIVQPVLRLCSCLSEKVEICFHSSLALHRDLASQIYKACQRDVARASGINLILREGRRKL